MIEVEMCNMEASEYPIPEVSCMVYIDWVLGINTFNTYRSLSETPAAHDPTRTGSRAYINVSLRLVDSRASAHAVICRFP